MKERSPASGVSIGGLTVLVIFTVLCLTIFSVISLASAQADRRLSDKNLEQTVRYYDADGKAEEHLKAVDQALQRAALLQSSQQAEYYFNMVARDLAALDTDEIKGTFSLEKQQYTYELPVSDVLNLRVSLQIQYDNGRSSWSILEWKTYSTVDFEIDENITLWDGL